MSKLEVWASSWIWIFDGGEGAEQVIRLPFSSGAGITILNKPVVKATCMI
jgi:hypothetical protein